MGVHPESKCAFHIFVYYQPIQYPADLNERDSLEMVRKQVRKMIIRGLGE